MPPAVLMFLRPDSTVDQSRLFPFESKHAYEKTRQNDVKWSPSLFADRTGRIPRDRSGTEQDLEKRERAC